jgi:hypothetical protein
VTYADVGFASARREEEQGPDAGVHQVTLDLTRLVTFFTLWTLTGLDETPRVGESGHVE